LLYNQRVTPIIVAKNGKKKLILFLRRQVLTTKKTLRPQILNVVIHTFVYFVKNI